MGLNWFSGPPKKKSAGTIGRVLGRIAPTWNYSLWRRVVQAFCLLTFLVFFLYVCFPYTASPSEEAQAWPSHYADDMIAKEVVPAELFLAIDPLVSISTAIAARTWVWSLTFAGAILVVSLLVPRGFCGYVCPLGTVIDLFDWAVGRRVRWFHVSGKGWYVHLKYYLLAGVLVSSLFGVLLSGLFAAIPIVTRAAAYLLTPLETGLVRSWQQIPEMHWGHFLSLALFAIVLGLGLLRPRFWCRYVCPTGAVFSIASLLRLTERKVAHTCIQCGKCVAVCSFDAIKADFTTRTSDCTFCQTCGGVCPVTAIQFVPRGSAMELKVAGEPPTGGASLGRRGFLGSVLGIAAGAIGGGAAAKAIASRGACLEGTTAFFPVRPREACPNGSFCGCAFVAANVFKPAPTTYSSRWPSSRAWRDCGHPS